MIKVTFKPSLQKVGRAFSDMKLGPAIQEGIKIFAFEIEGQSKRETPVDTGQLRASIRTDITTLKALIAPRNPGNVYAKWIHTGKMVRGGQTVYIKGGGRAGTPPGGKPFMKLGMDKAENKLRDKNNPVYKEVEKYIDTKLKI